MIAFQILLLFSLFSAKHWVTDFLLQGPYQFQNKGTYLHPGGLLHALIVSLGSFLVLIHFPFELAKIVSLCVCEFLVHYHVDWMKVNITRYFNLHPMKHPEFWFLLGFDQMLHYLTYVWMIWMLV